MSPRLRSIAAKIPGWSPAAGEPKPLEGGITNRNFVLAIGGERFVLKLDGAQTAALGIDRGRERRCAAIAAKLGVGPEVYHFLPRERSLVTRFIEGSALSPRAARRPALLKRIVASIKRVHGGPRFPGRFSAFDTVLAYRRAALRRGVRLPRELDHALLAMRRIEASLGPCRAPKPCHNDLLAGNFIDDGRVVRILDWEYAAKGWRASARSTPGGGRPPPSSSRSSPSGRGSAPFTSPGRSTIPRTRRSKPSTLTA